MKRLRRRVVAVGEADIIDLLSERTHPRLISNPGLGGCNQLAGRKADQTQEVSMTFTRHLRVLSLAATALALATPAFALNPQPLPPGMRFNPAAVNHAQGVGAWTKGPLVLRCYGVQVGDPHTHPPVRVCP
jgi:hypothetical protein